MYDYDSSYVAAGSLVGGIVGGMLIFFIIFYIIIIALAVLKLIGQWKILKKANKHGWGALIPFYGQYLMCKISGVNPWWILIVALSPILSIIPVLGSLASLAASIYFLILLNVSLARSYGKEDGFAVGMILLAPIFYFVLGEKENVYLGPKPMKDFLFKNQENSNNPNNNQGNVQQQYQAQQPVIPIQPQEPVQQANTICPNCGNVQNFGKFCVKCGKQLM